MSVINVGNLGSTAVSYSNTVTPVEPNDVFRFNLTGTSNINLALTDISIGDDVDLSLYRDNNNNGRVDSGDTFIASSSRGSNADDAINLADQSAGHYLAQVNRYAPGSSGSASYRLSLSTADPSNVLPVENNLGNLTADVSRTGQVGNNNTAETYAFSLDYFSAVNITMTPSPGSGDADIALFADRNGNRIVDAGDQLVRSTAGTGSTDSIRLDDAGSYLLQVYQFSGNTNYTLNFDHSTTSYV